VAVHQETGKLGFQLGSKRTLSHYNHLLLSEAQRDRIDVVLVSPRNPLNIGAAARAMANFGFSRLSVVVPYAPHWREARSAVGAPELLAAANETATLAEAVAECTLVVGTGTLTYRKPEQPVISLPELAPLVGRELARSGRVAVVFGPEKHGLTREDLSYCHYLVEILTDMRQPSMNLGQAVAVCLYELACRGARPEMSTTGDGDEQAAGTAKVTREKTEKCASEAKAQDDLAKLNVGVNTPTYQPVPFVESGPSAAPSGDLEVLAGVIEETLTAAGYSPRSMQPANRHDLRLLLRRLAPAKQDTRRILGVFRRILWRLKR
jgi:tRNA/rRNA methyltransferase